MANFVEQFGHRWFRNEKSKRLLVLAGNPGCGKTRTARAFFQWASTHAIDAICVAKAWPRVPSVDMYRWPDITDGFKEGRYSVIEDMLDSDMLIIDDIGAEHDPSKNATDKLCQILSHREFKFTLMTTNIVPGAWWEKFEARVADRLLRNSTVVDLSNVGSYAFVK